MEKLLNSARKHMMNKLGPSVLVYCCNSARRLPPTLQVLAEQLPANVQLAVEALVIENAFKDDTSAVTEGLLGSPGLPHAGRVLYQAVPGKSHALELGLREARYEYVVILDDDTGWPLTARI